jgi:hypothetical protein
MATIDELYQQSLLGNLPTTLTPYQRIMGQMTPTMNPYTGAGVAIGGYDPALYRRMSGSGLINLGGGGAGGMGGGGMGGGGGISSGPISPTTPEEFAAQSARNQQLNDFLTGLTKMSPTGLLMSGLNTMFGSQRPAPVEDVGTYFGKNPMNDFGFATQAEADAINAAINEAAGFAVADDAAAAAQQNNNVSAGLAAAADAAAAAQGSVADQNTGGDGGGYGGYSDSAGGSFGEGQYNMGGPVDRVGGPNPPGPDDGTGMLQLGEYVIKKSAVKKYGAGLLDMINDGKIPAKKMKSLLG